MRACYSGGTIVAASLLYAVLCAQTGRRKEKSITIDGVEWRICKKGLDDWAYRVRLSSRGPCHLVVDQRLCPRNSVLGKRLAMTGKKPKEREKHVMTESLHQPRDKISQQ